MTSVWHAVRRLRRAPAFTMTAVATIAVALSVLGALTSFWSGLIANVQPGIGDPQAVVRITPVWSSRHMPYPTRAQHASLVAMRPSTIDLAFYSLRILPIGTGGPEVRTLVHAVSDEYFAVLGAKLAAGLGLADSSGSTGLRPAVVSWRFWQDYMAAAPNVLGQRLTVGPDTTYIVAGVASPRFHGPEGLGQADVWIRTTPDVRWDRGRMIGRLRGPAGMNEAAAELAALWPRAREAGRRGDAGEWSSSRLTVDAMRGGVHRESHLVIGTLLGGVASIAILILLIATVNLAALILTRAVARERDLSVKRALGARMRDIVNEPVIEVLILFAIAGVAGILLARPAGVGLIAALGVPYPFVALVRWDAPTILGTLGLAMGAAILCGVAPATRTAHIDPGAALRADAGATRVRVAGRRLQSAMLAAQLGITFILVGISVGIALNAARLIARQSGVRDPSSVVVAPAPPSAGTSEQRAHAGNEFMDLIRRATGAAEVAHAFASPGENRLLRTTLDARAGRGRPVPARVNIVSPSFFDVLGVPVRRGRAIEGADVLGSDAVVVLSQSAATEFFGADSPVGRRIVLDVYETRPVTVVGVVGDIAYELSTEREPVVYVAAAQFDPALGREMVFVRSPAARSASRRIDSLARAANPAAAIRAAQPLAQRLADATQRERSLLALVVACAAVAVSIALLGVFGLVAYRVQQQRREIAVRLALGASPFRITWMHAAGTLRVALIGITFGALFALMGHVLLESLFAIAGTQVVQSAALAGALLLASTVVATVLAVRISASFSPAALLRTD